MKEEWQDIAGYEGLYQVSNLGRVKSLNYGRTGKEKILSPGNNWGYQMVSLYKNGIRKQFKIHRLVAETFIPNPDNFSQINHRDENRKNNRVNNLEWCSVQYNLTYNNRHIKATRKLAKKIGCFKDGKLIKVYDAVRDVKKAGFHDGNVCSALKGRRKSAGGYHWQYLD